MTPTNPPGTAGPASAPRRTRVPDQLTNAMLVVTAVFGVWAVALVVVTTIGILKPAFYYSDQKSAIKALGATVVAVLAVSQTWTMEATMGHLPRGTVRSAARRDRRKDEVRVPRRRRRGDRRRRGTRGRSRQDDDRRSQPHRVTGAVHRAATPPSR